MKLKEFVNKISKTAPLRVFIYGKECLIYERYQTVKCGDSIEIEENFYSHKKINSLDKICDYYSEYNIGLIDMGFCKNKHIPYPYFFPCIDIYIVEEKNNEDITE